MPKLTFPPSLHSIARRLLFSVGEATKAHLRRYLKAPEVRAVHVRPGLSTARHVAVIVVQNEGPRLEYLLEYHRRIGIQHFLVVDNLSTDDIREQLADATDVSLYEANGQFARARYGYDWANRLLNRHCVGKWVLYLDADEFFVFGPPGTQIEALTAEMERRGMESLGSFMLDMYSDRPIAENVYRRGDDPLEICTLFDADSTGYERRFDDASGTTWIKGGVRGRLFFPELWDGPALNKTPLIRWRRHYAFLKATHQAFPRRVNLHFQDGVALAPSTLLHFKFLANAGEALTSDRNLRQHTSEYSAYATSHEVTFVGSSTQRYTYAALLESGLISPLLPVTEDG